MPAYPGNAQAKLLRNNNYAFMWNGETVPAGAVQGSLSVAFQLERINRSFYPWGCSFEAAFGGAPGAFSITIMGANIDNAANYSPLGTIIAVNGSNVGRFDMPANVFPKFVAGFVTTLANAVPVTLQVSH